VASFLIVRVIKIVDFFSALQPGLRGRKRTQPGQARTVVLYLSLKG